ncbi:MAG: hypothetical protein Q8P20_06065 [bacterium]|nr:hypothetical protein [bacterium]
MEKIYNTKSKRLAGTRYEDVYDNAFGCYDKIKKLTKRRPYIRSAYFKKQKVFIEVFRQHLYQKNWRDRVRRMRLFPAGIELIRKSHFSPKSIDNPNNLNEILHRFSGKTSDGYLFFVQIKENKRNGDKTLISVFPAYQ